jgi:hypothetical protein
MKPSVLCPVHLIFIAGTGVKRERERERERDYLNKLDVKIICHISHVCLDFILSQQAEKERKNVINTK